MKRAPRSSTVVPVTMQRDEEVIDEIRELLRHNRSDLSALGRRLREDLREDFQVFAHEILKGHADFRRHTQPAEVIGDAGSSLASRGRCRKKPDTPLPAGGSAFTPWQEAAAAAANAAADEALSAKKASAINDAGLSCGCTSLFEDSMKSNSSHDSQLLSTNGHSLSRCTDLQEPSRSLAHALDVYKPENKIVLTNQGPPPLVWNPKPPWQPLNGHSMESSEDGVKGLLEQEDDRDIEDVANKPEDFDEDVSVPGDPPPLLPLHTPMSPPVIFNQEDRVTDLRAEREFERLSDDSMPGRRISNATSAAASVVAVSNGPATATRTAAESLRKDGSKSSAENSIERPGMLRTSRSGEDADLRSTPREKVRDIKKEQSGPNYAANRLSLTRELAKAKKALRDQKPLYKMSVREIIFSTRFDNLVGMSIVLNAITIGVQTDHMARNTTEEAPAICQVFEYIFAVWFTFELSLRLYVFRTTFWSIYTPGWGWNYFDFAVVFAQVLEMFASFWQSVGNIDPKSFKLLRVLRILRLVRILRVLRVLHLISELRTIVSSIVGSFSSLGWTVVLLSLMIYIVAVYFTQSVNQLLVEKGFDLSLEEDDPGFNPDVSHLKSYFGSLGRAVLTLWEAMSGGMDWDGVADPLLQEIGVLTAFMFAAYIAFALLALLNVVTGVFVQTALNSAKKEEDAFMSNQIIGLFEIVDRKPDAMISFHQVSESLDDPKTSKDWKSVGVAAEEARYLFRLLDIHNDGRIPFEEFLSGCLRLNGPAKALDLLTVMQEARTTNERMFSQINSICSTMNKIAGSCAQITSSLNTHAALREAVNENRQIMLDARAILTRREGTLSGIYCNLETLVSALIPQDVSLV